MMFRKAVSLISLISVITASSAFVVTPGISQKVSRASPLKATASDKLNPGDAVLLIGPGFLQLNIAKAAKAAGLNPIIVAPQNKIENFVKYTNDEDLIRDATIGIPDPGEPYYGEIAGVVYCAEDAILQESIVSTILDWKDRDVFSADGIRRAIACTPISGKINQEKSMGWMPIFNNDKQEKDAWTVFTKAFKDHPVMEEGAGGTMIRYGSLLGGSIDGSDELQALGLDESIYKMTLENYRDLKERSFDRYRIGAQVLEGDAVNPQPPNQEKMEKEAIKVGEQLEAFRAVAGYPEIDRTNRHIVAQATVQALMRPDGAVPKEFTVLSKCESTLPTNEDWDTMFANPKMASWPDPFAFDPTKYGFEVEKK